VTSTLSQARIPKYASGTSLVVGSTWTIGLSAPTGLVANGLSRVAFLVRFRVDGDCDVAPVGGGGGGGELGGVAICL